MRAPVTHLSVDKPSPRLPISLCMIVKNEARLISSCLERALRVVSQAVVIDTGSSDNTAALAEAAGAEVYHHPWEGHFSIARNQSLSYAREPWVMILDGDELLSEGAEQALRALELGEGAPEAYEFTIVNFTTDRADEREASLQQQIRLFRRSPEHGYQGLIHNQLLHLGQQRPLKAEPCEVRVLHYGYTPSVWAAQRKDERLELLERAVLERPNDPFHHYNLGNHLKILKRYEEALASFLRALELLGPLSVESPEWAPVACCSAAFCALSARQPEVALQLTTLVLEVHPHLIDAHLRATEALLSLERPQEVVLRLSQALTHPERSALKLSALYERAPYRLGRAMWLSGEARGALAMFCSLAPYSRDETVFTHLALCAAACGRWGLWSLACERGRALAPHDPDWEVVEAHAARLKRAGVVSRGPVDGRLSHPRAPLSLRLLCESEQALEERFELEQLTSWSPQPALAYLEDNAPLSALTPLSLIRPEALQELELCWLVERSAHGAQLALYHFGERAWCGPALLPLLSAVGSSVEELDEERREELNLWLGLTLNALLEWVEA